MDYHKLQFARRLLRKAVRERETQWSALRDAARDIADAGRLDDAVRAYEQLLSTGAKKPAWWAELARLYEQQGRFQSAVDAQLRSLTLAPASADGHYALGTLLAHVDVPGQAVREYLETLPPGHRLMVEHRVADAIAEYDAACQARPEDNTAMRHLASALEWSGDRGRAARLLGRAAFREERYATAIREFTRARSLDSADATAYAELAAALNRTRRYAEAIDVCHAGIAASPDEGRLYRELAWALTETNQPEAVAATAVKASAALSKPLFLSAARYLSLPIVYDTVEQIAEWRARFDQGLRRFSALLDEHEPGLAEARDEIDPNFYLAYQGQNDLEQHRAHGRLISRIMSASYPEWACPRRMPPLTPEGKIRVGYVFSGHTGIDPVFLSWMTDHDRSRFEIVAYQVGGVVDPASHGFRSAATRFHHLPEQLDQIGRQIVADDLHILVFLYIGMGSLWSQLAGLRLAPVQCVTWGHPMTTGLPTIDYFLSNDLMEPDDADTHYSETLVRLPGIGVSPSPPFLPPLVKTRQDFGLPEDAIVYLSPQAPAKYLPQYDHVLVAIAERVPDALIVLSEPHAPEVGRCLKDRLRRAFAGAGRDSAATLRFLPNLPYDDFLQLMLRSDIFLDTIGWSGGLTTIDAARCTLPIVTCAGSLMRGRQSAGMLAQMGVTEGVATSVEGFLDLAVDLGLHADRRGAMAERLREAQDRLFGIRTCVPALEAFYRTAVAAATD